MKRTIIAIATLGFLLAFAGPTSAAVHIFEPTPADLFDLTHIWYYSWGIDFELEQDEVIVDAVLTFKNIRNWQDEPNVLFIHLLDYAALGVTGVWDEVAEIEDFYVGDGPLIDAYTDTDASVGSDLSYSLKDLGYLDELDSYIGNDGRFGFGFDPDCHYFNDGIQLTIITSTPEPGTMALFALGLTGGIAAYRRRKK